MTHKKSVSILASLLRPENDPRPTILLGAGASFSSGVPLAAESVKRIAKQVYADHELGGRLLPEQIKTSEWTAWLHDQGWFIHGEDRIAENFPLVIEHLLKPEAYRRRTLLDLVNLRGELGTGYRALADLVLRGLAGTILTTNFDMCLPKALNDKRPHIRHVAEVNRGPDDFIEFNLYARAQIVWLHGKAEQYTDRNLIEETRTLGPKLLQHVTPLLNATPLIVVGYRGAEPSIMEALLGRESELDLRNGVYWCCRKGESLHPNVEALARRLGSNFRALEIDGFDQLFCDLNRELAGVQRFFEGPAIEQDAKFDDQIVKRAGWADIDASTALATLQRYCEKLERGPIGSEHLKPLMRELGLLVREGDTDRPTVACILLFGRDLRRFFPHAVVSATVGNKKRRVFGGNLIEQYHAVLEWLEDKDVNPTLKVKRGRKHEKQKAYPERALVELLVNMLVHRDYEIRKPSFINVTPNESIRYLNPGAHSQTASTHLEFDEQGVFEPVPEFSDLRNRALCDVFFGMSAMERAGTGLVDAGELAFGQGGAAQFAFPPSEDAFAGILYRPEASAGSNTIAKDTRPVGTYLINMLPFSAMPQQVTRLRIQGGWSEMKRHAPLSEAGTFVFEARSGELWSFASAPLLSTIFEPIMTEPAQEITIGDMEDDDVLRKKLSWLIRKHFEQYLGEFADDGLVIEKSKRGHPAKRAYFQSYKGRNRTIVYDSPNRRNIRRDVVKKRGDSGKPWFECEGFGYEVVKLSGMWGIRIKPFYMFAKQDGVTPLPGYLRTSRSTRRFRFDRNANVESDLVFWARFLSDGAHAVNIGDEYVSDLLLDGVFYTIDVQEGGLLSDVISIENKRTA